MSESVPAELAARVENGTHPGSSGAKHMALSSLQQHLQAHAGDSNYLGTHTVLLCDDDPVTLRTVEQLLRKFGYKVITATNARDAISHLQASKAPGGQPVDLVLTDILMPEVSGLDLMHEVIHGTLFSEVPVVVMSSQDSQESVLQAFEAGASDYLIKPLRRNEVATLWQHVWRANRFKAHKDTSTSEPAALGDSAAPRQKGAEGTACEDPTGGSNTAETDHGSNEAGSVVPTAGPKPPALSGPHSGSATNTIAYSEQHTRLHASRFSQQAAAQSNADNASGPSSGENTVNDTGGPAAARLTRPSHPPHMLQASDNADTCTDAAVITTDDDDDELREPATNRARHSSDLVPQPQGTQDQHTQHNHHHHHKGQQQVTSGGPNKAVSSGQHHGTSSKLDSPAPSSSDLKQDLHHHSQQHPTRPIAERSNAQGSRALQELAVLGHMRQEQREMSVGQGSEGPAGLHHKAESQMMVVQQKASVKKETMSEPVPDTMWQDMDQQRQQEEEDAETAEAAGLLLGVAAAAAAEQQAARRAAHTSTGISGRSNRSNNGSHSNGGWGPAAGGAGGRSHGASASTAAATVAGANTAGQAGRTAFSALTVFLPRGMAPTLPAAANGTLPSSEGEGTAPNPAPVRNSNGTQHHNAIRHHSSSLEPDGPVTTPASGYATTPGSSSFLSTPSAKAAGHSGHMNGMGDRPMDAEMNNHAASMFMHPGAGLMLPQSIMPLLAYSLAGMHPELQQSMYMAHGIPPSEHPSGFMDSAMQQHPGMPQHVMPSVVLVAGRGESTSTAAAHRRAAVQKYLQKKKNRNFKKKVRYESRKRLAEARPRVRGQFVKQDPAAVTAAAASKSGAADLATAQSLSQEPSSSGNKQSRDDQGSGGGNASGRGRLQSRLKKRQRQGSVATDNNGHDDEECGGEDQEGLTEEEEEGANAE